VSNLLHGVVHVVSNDPRGPRAPIRKHGVGQNIDVDLTSGQSARGRPTATWGSHDDANPPCATSRPQRYITSSLPSEIRF
jgi:hypothetical protein